MQENPPINLYMLRSTSLRLTTHNQPHTSKPYIQSYKSTNRKHGKRGRNEIHLTPKKTYAEDHDSQSYCISIWPITPQESNRRVTRVSKEESNKNWPKKRRDYLRIDGRRPYKALEMFLHQWGTLEVERDEETVLLYLKNKAKRPFSRLSSAIFWLTIDYL